MSNPPCSDGFCRYTNDGACGGCIAP
jgi:hypothetical protein